MRSVFAGRFVVLDDDGIALFLGNFDGKDLRFEEAGLAGANGFLVAFDGEAVLLFAGDAVFFGDEFAGHAHVKVFVRVPQTVVNHGVDQLSVAQAVAAAGLGQQIWAVGHGFHAAGYHDFGFAELHGLRGEGHGFEAGAANFVDRQGRDAWVAAAFEGCLASGILAEPGLDYVAEDGFVDLLGVETRAAGGFGDHLGAELRSGKT